MNEAADLTRIAHLLADPARASMLWTLIDGTTRPAGELAYAANVSAQSASAHLATMVTGGLLEAQSLGRHRYFRLAGPEVARLIESMASLGAGVAPRSPRHPPLVRAMPSQFLHARTCYDHLAGEMAVKVLAGMLKARWLTANGEDYAVTRRGEGKLAELGVDLAAARSGRRAFARGCVDLTQR